jgi:SAM-dependent methyltransferase
MADVYDDWYEASFDTDAAVAAIARLAGPPGHGARLLELGVGTGRLALPLAAEGFDVYGVDSSAAMVARLRAKPGGDRIAVTIGDMAESEPPGPFRLVYVVANTFFSLVTAADQQQAMNAVAARLEPGGRFVCEAFVADVAEPTSKVDVRSLAAERVVLTASVADPSTQTVDGQFIELTPAGGVTLRPWSIRWSTPTQLDAMASTARLALEARWGGWRQEPFDRDSAIHVSVWRRSTGVG